MATLAVPVVPTIKGGAFLLETRTPQEIYSPEDFTDEHRAIAKTTEEFWAKEVGPNVEAIQQGDKALAISIVKKSAQLGLTAVTAPEEYGGMEMDMVAQMVVAEALSKDGSYSGWHGAHAGIGTTPVLLWGTPAQKEKYLTKLASAELIGAYCLSEPQAGSDALAAKTRADLSADGTHYILNGQKMWITNGGGADLYTVFAKINGEKDKFTAFLVERAWPGVQPGHEEKKMGIKGSSTTAVYFDNVKVPVENVLGEIGRGHIIAFNVLNLGRLKLGPFAVGGSKNVLSVSIKYAKERQAFGQPIANFGLMQHKIAEMAIKIFAAESMTYRVVGDIESNLQGWSWKSDNAAHTYLKAVEEFAAECSYIKVFASETLDYVVDEGVQIHGGYGYHQDYLVERAYRDSRINRIFEGTSEINRLLATGTLLKRAQRGTLPLVAAVKALQAELMAPPALSAGALSAAEEENRMAANAKKLALLCLGAAYQRFMDKVEREQEVMAGITDIAMNAFAIESVSLRAQKLAALGKGEMAAAMSAVFCREAMDLCEQTAKVVLSACAEGDNLRIMLAAVKRLAKYEPANSIGLRRQIAEKLIAAEKYTL
ncbi:MAG: acyl-CoA dehydrogenase family protein [Acidobacteria bacterium]|nr:acyl-CoA dehydrogenase family protein [Acidobacteriota bacterium]